jgi:acetyl-CoA synthetase
MWPILVKARDTDLPPNLSDYDTARATFSWSDARAELDGLPGGRGINIAHEAVDRHATGPAGGRTALRFLRRDAAAIELSYRDLQTSTSRFANVLAGLGLHKGERVFSLLGRVPELYVSALGALKARAVFSPLFSAFGPEPLRQRLVLGNARVLVTSASLARRKLLPILAELPELEYILLVDVEDELGALPRTLGLPALMGKAADTYEIGDTDPTDMALLHFTSGTTGTPKGAVHVHDAVVAHHLTGSYALDLHEDDVFWCTADPGWVTGTSYGIISPLTHGVTSIIDEEDFDATRWYETLERERVSVWYTAPTALRMLMKAGPELAARYDLRALRFIASVGEPLNPQIVLWGARVLGRPVHDNWWQTETGGIMIANFAVSDIRPGSMGRPLPGIEAGVALRDSTGELAMRDGELVLAPAGVEGELVLRPGWPSMFRSYLHEPERYARCFVGGWYRSGDLATCDGDGYFWFVGRGDDVIKSAGHLIGPFEVESAFLEHPAVVEVAAVGIPDPVVGETVKAFVTLHAGYEESDELRRELLGWGRTRLGAAVAPKEIAFAARLPHTSSGKIMRRLLRARELGLPEGDISTLEAGS